MRNIFDNRFLTLFTVHILRNQNQKRVLHITNIKGKGDNQQIQVSQKKRKKVRGLQSMRKITCATYAAKLLKVLLPTNVTRYD